MTDNAANMKRWQLLENSYQGTALVCYGCIAHALNLLLFDLQKYYTLNGLISQCKEAVKVAKRSHILCAKFKEKQASEPDNKPKLTSKLPARTRWGSVVACLKSLQVNKRALQLLAINETTQKQFTNSSNIQANLLSDSFWKNLDGFVTVLEPISTQITIIESDESRISNVHSIFMRLENHFHKPLPISPFSMEERELMPLKSLVQESNFVFVAFI